MAIVFAQPSGTYLAGTTAPIEFTATDPAQVLAVSVSFAPSRAEEPPRAEERVWRDGVFLYPYQASTRAAGAFSVRREGGWPLSPTLYVDECGASATVVVDAGGNIVMAGGDVVTP